MTHGSTARFTQRQRRDRAFHKETAQRPRVSHRDSAETARFTQRQRRDRAYSHSAVIDKRTCQLKCILQWTKYGVRFRYVSRVKTSSSDVNSFCQFVSEEWGPCLNSRHLHCHYEILLFWMLDENSQTSIITIPMKLFHNQQHVYFVTCSFKLKVP